MSTPVAAVAGVEVRGVVVQWADGTVAADGNDRPRVFLDDTQYDLDEARALAAAIIAAAEQAEQWQHQAADDAWADPAWQINSDYCARCNTIGCHRTEQCPGSVPLPVGAQALDTAADIR